MLKTKNKLLWGLIVLFVLLAIILAAWALLFLNPENKFRFYTIGTTEIRFQDFEKGILFAVKDREKIHEFFEYFDLNYPGSPLYQCRGGLILTFYAESKLKCELEFNCNGDLRWRGSWNEDYEMSQTFKQYIRVNYIEKIMKGYNRLYIEEPDSLKVCTEYMEEIFSDDEIQIRVSDKPDICPLHQKTLEYGFVPIYYGLILRMEEYVKAEEKNFPNSNHEFLGGCCMQPQKKALIKYCPDCRKAYQEWFKTNKKKGGHRSREIR